MLDCLVVMEVIFWWFSEQDIVDYVVSGEFLDKVGVYGI